MVPFTILLVEDDHDVREALGETLSDRGYDVQTATDGQDALRVLRGGLRPRLILLDLMMPRMSGAEFRVVQQADPALASLPVVLLSADGRMEEKAQALGVNGAIRKPIDLDELFATIDRICGTQADDDGGASKTSA